MKQFFAFGWSFAIMTLMSGCVTCTGEEDCFNPELPVKSLESEYGCPDTRHQLNIDLSQTHIIIRSQADFDRLVTGSCRPQIDFTTYDLLIGKKGLSSGNSSIKYTLQRDCKTNQAQLRVLFQQNPLTIAPNITYHALVPKLAPSEDVKVEIEVRDGQL